MAYFIRLNLIYWIISYLIILALFIFLRLRYLRKLNLLEQLINKKTEELISEKQKREALLANVLPKSSANEIVVKGKG